MIAFMKSFSIRLWSGASSSCMLGVVRAMKLYLFISPRVRHARAAWGSTFPISVSASSSLVHSSSLAFTCALIKDVLPTAEPRIRAPSLTISIPVPSNSLRASSIRCGLTRILVFLAFGKYPRGGPNAVILSHHSLSDCSFPHPVASSAIQTWRHPCVSVRLINGIAARANIGIASGSPWVVPSSERIKLLSIFKCDGFL